MDENVTGNELGLSIWSLTLKRVFINSACIILIELTEKVGSRALWVNSGTDSGVWAQEQNTRTVMNIKT